LKVAVVLAIIFAIAGGLVLITPVSTNFEIAAAQEEQQQQQSSTLNNTVLSQSITEADSGTSSNSVTDNQTTFGEPLPSPTQSNATMLRGEIGSIQSAHQGTFSWGTAGEWVMQLDGPLIGRADPRIESFNATIHMVRLDGNVLYEHEIYNFNQSSVTHLGDNLTTFNGTMTVTLREGPIENVTGYIQLLGDSIAIFIDPRAVEDHFGPTPIHGVVLPEEEEEQVS
jgi:archaellum component FlaF (FlaF/FlaG flagellin family)